LERAAKAENAWDFAVQDKNQILAKTVARATRVSRPTLRNLLRAYEGLILIREATPLGGTARSSYFLEDQGMATHLAGAPWITIRT
jgi:predicted AAA+ superfamily ATPase